MKLIAILTADSDEIGSGSVACCLSTLEGEVESIVLVWREDNVDAVLPDVGAYSNIEIVRTERCGVARARNVGLDHLEKMQRLHEGFAICFPDDDCMFPAGIGRELAKVLENADLVQVPYGPTADGVDRERFPRRAHNLDARTVVRTAASAGLFVRAEHLGALRFEESLGVGTSAGAGEELDLILRLLASGCVGRYLPEPVVIHPYGPFRPERVPGNIAAMRWALGAVPGMWPILARALVSAGLRLCVRNPADVRLLFAGLRAKRIAEFQPPSDESERWPPSKVGIARGLSLSVDHPSVLVESISRRWASRGANPLVVLAAHVTVLNELSNPRLILAFEDADIAHVDGLSISWAAWLSKRRWLYKLATTDMAPQIIERMATLAGRRVRIAVIGGEPGIADAAGFALSEALPCEVVSTSHGFHSEWNEVLSEVASAHPDMVVVGLGMPTEAIWCMENRNLLPSGSVIITCGGWLRLLAGTEKRSPPLMQVGGLEWLYRLLTDPKRTWRRYVRGAGVLAALVLGRLSRTARKH